MKTFIIPVRNRIFPLPFLLDSKYKLEVPEVSNIFKLYLAFFLSTL